jgi:hypothetical protein
MTPDELLQRLSQTLRKEIGPAIESEYSKTQAFMASVVTQKLGRQVGLERAHERADAAELDALIGDLGGLLEQSPGEDRVAAAIEDIGNSRDKVRLCAVIVALYAARDELGEVKFSALLNRVRLSLRANINRQMEYAA